MNQDQLLDRIADRLRICSYDNNYDYARSIMQEIDKSKIEEELRDATFSISDCEGEIELREKEIQKYKQEIEHFKRLKLICEIALFDSSIIEEERGR